MARKTTRTKLKLTAEQRIRLERLSKSCTAPLREIQRAQTLLHYVDELPITEIQKRIKMSRPSIYKCIDKALAAGPESGLKDYYHRPFDPVITDEAKAWVINLASCTKPKDHGMAAELWTHNELAKYTRKHAPGNGHECLSKAVKATIWRILSANAAQPHKITYLVRRDPDFERKMQEILMVYQEVNLQNEQNAPSGDHPALITVSVDEKTGVQAIKNIAPDLPPKPGVYKTASRDYEYKRLGTVSILAALDLHDGKILAQVHDRHRSREFVSLLKELDAYYPSESTIRVVLDKNSSHISKETMKYLESRPGRFIYVHTPKHGSWLNLVESAFSRMARTFLRHIRVNSKEELKSRILQGINEINASPVIHRWKKFDFAIT